MGQFSWFTQDDDAQIIEIGSRTEKQTVYLIDDNGNKYREDNYEGYGEFGGMDYFVLLARMNNVRFDEPRGTEEEQNEKLRSAGIELTYPEGQSEVYGIPVGEIRYPNLVSDPNTPWSNEEPDADPNQGWEQEDEADYTCGRCGIALDMYEGDLCIDCYEYENGDEDEDEDDF